MDEPRNNYFLFHYTGNSRKGLRDKNCREIAAQHLGAIQRCEQQLPEYLWEACPPAREDKMMGDKQRAGEDQLPT